MATKTTLLLPLLLACSAGCGSSFDEAPPQTNEPVDSDEVKTTVEPPSISTSPSIVHPTSISTSPGVRDGD